MTRRLQLLIVILAAFLFAGCAQWQRVKTKRQWQQFQREWGVPECFHGDPPRYYFPTPTVQEGNPPLTHTLP